MHWITTFASACLGLFIVACGAMWGLGVFSNVSLPATIAALLGILFATAIGTALMALAVYSNESGHDDIISQVEPDSSSQSGREE